MTVYITNFYKKHIIGIEVYCGRPKYGLPIKYGNPYPMKDESQRDKVCNDFDIHFDWEMEQNPEFKSLMYELLELAKTNDITLVCFCYPKRCHTEKIKKWLDEQLCKV